MDENLKILSITAANVKKLVAIRIDAAGKNMLTLTGGNGEGKTSALECISWALEGKAKIQKCPIRYGENKAWIEIDLGKYLVRRDFKFKKDSTEQDSTLTVTSKDGSEFPSPQALLDALYGELAFDPLAFSRASSKDQVAALEGLVKDFDFAKSRVEEELAYNERTIVNRKVKDASQTHISFKDVPVPKPEKVDVKALTESLAKASDTNVEIEKERAKREKEAKEKITDKVETKNRLAKEYEEIFNKATLEKIEAEKVYQTAMKKHQEAKEQHEVNKQILDSYEKEILEATEAQKSLPELAQPVDVLAIKTELDAATAKNALHEQWTKKNEARLLIEKYEAESKALTEKIEAIQNERKKAVAGAQIPVEGLGFDANGVTLNGIPFEQCSSGEKLKTSVILAMLSNPNLRVIRVADGSLLDDKGLQTLAELAKEKDYQIFIEKTDTTGNIGIVFEEGKIVKVNE